jgi:serine/threonine protein kinase
VAKLPRTLGRYGYEVVAVLGHGGMGSVYRARDPRLGRDLAIKLLREGYDSAELRDRFTREARSAGSLSHPNIVTIYDIDEHEGRPFIAMEYVPGQTFADLIRSNAPLPMPRKLQMMEEVCAGLAHAHAAGIVHRDIKPANLMIGPEGTVKILDFGIAKPHASGMTEPGVMLGTLNYMSPEQVTGSHRRSARGYLRGWRVLYELLSLHQAFPGEVYDSVFQRILSGSPVPLAEYCPDIDPRLVDIVDRALQKNTARRFQVAESLQNELATVRRSAPAIVPRVAIVRTSDKDHQTAVLTPPPG